MSDSACSSQQTNTSLGCRHTHTNTTGCRDSPSIEKQTTSSDVKNPSVVKVAPFSHQPSPNSAKSSVVTSSSSSIQNSSSIETNSQVKPEDQIVMRLLSKVAGASGSDESVGNQTCLAPDGELMTVFAPTADGQMRPICRTICSCQLRKRALKYRDKGKTKDDSILIDSDNEDENRNPIDSVNNQGIAWLETTYFLLFFWHK